MIDSHEDWRSGPPCAIVDGRTPFVFDGAEESMRAKRWLLASMAAVCLMASTAPAQTQRGGIMGFIAGCCFGVRAAGAYNDGKEIHWREWVMLIPYVNIVFAIWNGVDGANGVTTSELAKRYGASYY